MVNDGKVSSAPATVTISYENSPPVAVANSSVVAGIADLDGGYSYDDDYDPLIFSWTFTAVPAGSAITDASLFPSATSAAPFFIPDVPGLYTAELTVTEDIPGGLSDTATVTFTP